MKKLLAYVTATAIMLCLSCWMINAYLRIRDSITIENPVETITTEKFQVRLCEKRDSKQEGGTSVYLKWWHHTSTGTYYLFVPKDIPLYWEFTHADNVWVDNKLIRENDAFKLEAGAHLLQVNIEEEPKEYSLFVMYSSPVNALFLETESGSMEYINSDKEKEESGKYTLITSGGIYGTSSGFIQSIHGRGNASWRDTEKKSYQIELEAEADFVGIGIGKKWILIANSFDVTLLRNRIAFEMSEKLGLSYTPGAEYVDVYVNGEYLGNYLLCEKIEVGKNRVDIVDIGKETQQLNPNCKLKDFPMFVESYDNFPEVKGYRIANDPVDISGGYLLELDIKKRYDLEQCGFITAHKQCVVIKAPKNPSYLQATYIADKYQEFENAVMEADGVNPHTGKYYREYIDVESFARKYLLEEVTKNLDSAFSSQFLYKPEDTVSHLLYAGPVWDYDKSMGYVDVSEPEGLYANRSIKGTDIWGEIYPHENLWHLLCQHEDYNKRVTQIYDEEFRDIVLIDIENLILEQSELLEDSAVMNAVRWGLFDEVNSIEEKVKAYQENIAMLRSFLSRRIEYLDQIWK